MIGGYQNPGATGRSCVGLSANYTDTGDGMLYSNAGGVGIWSSIPTMPLAIFVDGTLETLAVSDTTVGNLEGACFDATGTIIVAGNSIVECSSGSFVDFIAGKSILLKPGFHAKSGSYVHAYISADGEFCSLASSSPVFNEPYKNAVINTAETEIEKPVNSNEPGLKVYPNPTTGTFSVEKINLGSKGNISISNVLGEVVYRNNYTSEGIAKFDLSHFGKGLYFIRVNDGKSIVTKKIVVK